jgi:hypothetical protein
MDSANHAYGCDEPHQEIGIGELLNGMILDPRTTIREDPGTSQEMMHLISCLLHRRLSEFFFAVVGFGSLSEFFWHCIEQQT